ncbi:hypothetical protein H6G70_16895 [Arthrospira platensis FACHB-439]|uniref:hypothetical protein n=1 Tax=Limnospira platensis TaxID=118562 RepID=UPI00168907FB|nr:hypothetical protein [Arthrospira platensis FACHB-439]
MESKKIPRSARKKNSQLTEPAPSDRMRRSPKLHPFLRVSNYDLMDYLPENLSSPMISILLCPKISSMSLRENKLFSV